MSELVLEETSDWFEGLTVELLQQVFPIVNSKRRENRDLFEPWIAVDAIRDDTLFYGALARIIRERPDLIRTFDHRMLKKRDKRKSFFIRSNDFLDQKVGGRLGFDELAELPDDHFPPGSDERAIHRLWRHIMEPIITQKISPVSVGIDADSTHAASEDGAGSDSDMGSLAGPADDWRELALELTTLCGVLDAPDPGRAAAIVDKAKLLLEACQAAAERVRAASARAERFEAIGLRLVELGLPQPSVTAAPTVSETIIEAIEERLAAAEKAQAVLARAREADEALTQQKNAASADEDLDTLISVAGKLKEARTVVQAARAAADAALADCREALADLDRAGCLEEEPGERSAPVPVTADALDEDAGDEEDEDGTAVNPDLVSSGRHGPSEGGPQGAPETVSTAPDEDSDAAAAAPSPVQVPPEPTIGLPAGANGGGAVGFAINGTGDRAAAQPAAPDDRADASDTGDDAQATCAAAQPLDELLAHYLLRGEFAFAHHLAALVEERGELPGVPSALLKALVYAPTFERPEDVADSRNQNLLAEAMAALLETEQGGDENRAGRARMIAFAALLRPALFDFNRTARLHLARVSLSGALQAVGPLAAELSGLGFDVQPSIDDLAEIHGREHQRKTPRALEDLRSWLETNRTARTSHQPTYRILHWLLAPAGTVGAVVEAALQGDPGAPDLARDLTARLAETERVVAEAEDAIGRPRRDRIEGLALSWITGRLEEGRAKIDAWIEARAADSLFDDDRRRATLQRCIGALTKMSDGIPGDDEREEPGLAGAVHTVLVRSLADFSRLLRGQAEMRGRSAAGDPLRTPLLRLPACCLPHWGDGDAYDDERALQRERLFAALQQPECMAPDLGAAFPARVDEGAMAAAAEILAHLERMNGEEAALRRMRQELEEAIHSVRDRARERVHCLRQDLATLLNLDLSSGEEIRLRLDRLDLIVASLSADRDDGPTIPVSNGMRNPEVPPDFCELEILLKQFDLFRDERRKRIRDDQQGRLERLERSPDRAAATRELIRRVTMIDPVTLDDMIADLEAGRDPLASDEGAKDAFAAFFPDFVDALAKERDLNRGRIITAATEGGCVGPLDFRSLDQTSADRAKALIETWGQVGDALSQRKIEKLQSSVAKLLGLIGFTGVRVEDERMLDQGRLHGLRLACDIPKAGRWFLPPDFGSIAKGSYRILVASAAVDPNQVATTVGGAPDRPWIVLHFGRLDRKGRETLARTMRQDRRKVLTLDEGLLLHLAVAGGDPLERLIACGAPFAWVQPYTTDPRNIPPEVFFGRREEIARITAHSSGGCLIYGGRQLGKSALLNQIRRDLHQPVKGQCAIYLDIGDIGAEPVPTSAVWQRIASALDQERGPVPKRADADGVLDAIRSWLDGAQERRILLMLDEADHFLAGEHPRCPNLRRMKDLMEATAWRFKVVFAGLHNVRRLAQAPNSPLVHLGEPVCIGPMNTTNENRRELRRLATQPIQAAGFVYDPPELAADILARVNHYPSLVQVFCKEIVGAANNSFRGLGPGPRWKLGREMLFEGGLASLIAKEIRKRFQWTLDLDPRYDLIAKCLALYRLDHGNGHAAVLRKGLTAEEIGRLVEPWWPPDLERVSSGDFRALLDEMVDLGVLGNKDEGRYGLRNAQVAQMIGNRDAIEVEILTLSEKEAKADYDAATYHRLGNPTDPDSLSPLPDRQLQNLFARGARGIRFVVAAPMLWGEDVGARLAALASAWEGEDGRPLQVLHHTGKFADLRGRIEKQRAVPLIVVIEGGWDKAGFDWLAKRADVRNGQVRPIWVVSPAQARQARTDGSEAVVFRAPTLGDTMLRHWLRGHGLAKLDDAGTRKAILAASGGVPVRLSMLRPILAELGDDNPTLRAARIGDWAAKHPLEADAVGLERAAAESFRDVARLLSGESGPNCEDERNTILQLVPSAGPLLPVFTESGLLEPFSDKRLQLTQFGRLLAR